MTFAFLHCRAGLSGRHECPCAPEPFEGAADLRRKNDRDRKSNAGNMLWISHEKAGSSTSVVSRTSATTRKITPA
jgi:hypothetical protein